MWRQSAQAQQDGSVTTAHVNRAKQQIAEQFAGHVDTKVYNHAAVLASSFCRGRAFAGKDARRKRTGRPREFFHRVFSTALHLGDGEAHRKAHNSPVARSVASPRRGSRAQTGSRWYASGSPTGAGRPTLRRDDPRAGCRSSIPTLGEGKLTSQAHLAPYRGADAALNVWCRAGRSIVVIGEPP